jgi:PAS domain S-box-containing protein
MLAGGSEYAHSFRILRPDGQMRVVVDHGRVFRDASGSALFSLGLNADMTPRHVDRSEVEPLSNSPTTCQTGGMPAIHAARVTAAEKAGQSVIEWDIPRDRVTCVIGSAGHKVDSLSDRALRFEDIANAVHPKDRARFRACVRAALDDPSGVYSSRFRMVLPNGAVHSFVDEGRVERDAVGKPARLVLISRDLTLIEEALTQTRAETAASNEATAILDSLFDAAPVGLGIWDRELRFRRVNGKLAEINGLPAEAHIGRRPDEILGDLDGLDGVLSRWRRVIETGTPWLDVEISGQTPAQPGITRHWREHFFPVRAGGEITGLAALIEEITEQRQAEQALRDSEAALRRLLDGALAMLGVLDTDGTIREVNAAALAYLRLDRRQTVGFPIWDCVADAAEPFNTRRLKAAVALARRGEQVRFDSEIAFARRPRTVLDVALTPVLNEEGAVTQIVVSAFDVTQRKEDQERIATVLQEIGHRSKNLLTLVQAIARHSLRDTPEDFNRVFGQRLQALATAQDLLMTGSNGVPMRRLVSMQLAHMGPDHSRVRIEPGEDLFLTPEAAEAFAMAIHELTTNAVKHGALTNDTGSVRFGWAIDPTLGTLSMRWQESGGPPVDSPSRRGFGSVVLDGLLTSKFDAQVTIDHAREGLAWQCRVKRSAVTAD